MISCQRPSRRRDQQHLVDVELAAEALAAGAVEGDCVVAVGERPRELAQVRAVGQAAGLAEELEDRVAAAVPRRRPAPSRARARRRPRRSPRRAPGRRRRGRPRRRGGCRRRRSALERSHRQAVSRRAASGRARRARDVPTRRPPGPSSGSCSRAACPCRSRPREIVCAARTRHPRTCCGCRSGRSPATHRRCGSRCPRAVAPAAASPSRS